MLGASIAFDAALCISDSSECKSRWRTEYRSVSTDDLTLGAERIPRKTRVMTTVWTTTDTRKEYGRCSRAGCAEKSDIAEEELITG
jgi:hypothetical protein